MNTALSWLRSIVDTLPGWLALTAALVIGAFVLVVVVHVFERVIFRVIGLIVSVSIAIVSHLLLHSVFVWLLLHYTTWRGSR